MSQSVTSRVSRDASCISFQGMKHTSWLSCLANGPRGLDPLLGVFTGILAYKMSETNPRTAPPPGETLGALVRWKWNTWKADRERQLGGKEEGAL